MSSWLDRLSDFWNPLRASAPLMAVAPVQNGIAGRNAPLITRDAILRFAPHADARIVNAVVASSAVALPKWGITTAQRLWMFMAMAKVESAGFTAVFEDMDYADAARIREVWPSRFPTSASAQPYVHQPEKLADAVYGGRMGNRPGTNDGFYCRATGLMATTGLDAFARLAKARGVSVDQCRGDLTSDATMLDCAAATFKTWGCLPMADRGDVIACTRAINGGELGLADRRAAYALAKKVWPKFPAPASSADLLKA